MALQDEVELDELVQGETGSVRPTSSRLLQILGLVFLLLAVVCLLAWATAGDSSAASNQDGTSPAVLWTLSPTWTLAPTGATTTLAPTGATTTLAPTGATTTLAPTVIESCVCSAGYPYCWPDDQHCYRSASSSEWSDTVCAGSCTSSLGGLSTNCSASSGENVSYEFVVTLASSRYAGSPDNITLRCAAYLQLSLSLCTLTLSRTHYLLYLLLCETRRIQDQDLFSCSFSDSLSLYFFHCLFFSACLSCVCGEVLLCVCGEACVRETVLLLPTLSRSVSPSRCACLCS